MRCCSFYCSTNGFLWAHAVAGNHTTINKSSVFFIFFLHFADKCSINGNACNKNGNCTVTLDKDGAEKPICSCEKGFTGPICSVRK